MGLQELHQQQADYNEILVRFTELMKELEQKVKDLASITHEGKKSTNEILDEAKIYTASCERIFAGEKGRTHAFFAILKSFLDEIRQNEELLEKKAEEIVQWTFVEFVTLIRSFRGYDDWPKGTKRKFIEELRKLLAEVDEEDEDPDRTGKVKVQPTLVLRSY